MWAGSIEVQGLQVPVTANVTPAFNRDFVVLGVTASYGDFSYTRHYNLRGGQVEPSVIADFRDRVLAAYMAREATIQFLLASGFAPVVP